MSEESGERVEQKEWRKEKRGGGKEKLSRLDSHHFCFCKSWAF